MSLGTLLRGIEFQFEEQFVFLLECQFLEFLGGFVIEDEGRRDLELVLQIDLHCFRNAEVEVTAL